MEYIRICQNFIVLADNIQGIPFKEFVFFFDCDDIFTIQQIPNLYLKPSAAGQVDAIANLRWLSITSYVRLLVYIFLSLLKYLSV